MMKVCIVGYGAIGPVHAKALENIDAVQIYAICDTQKERADDGAKKYNAKAFYDFDECINDKNIEYVHICTPHYLHFEMITKALDAGKRVVVEKPAVMKKSELDILFKEYDTSKIFPIIQNRTNACIKKIKELEASGDLGRLKAVKGILTWSRDENYYNSASWRGTREYEGGGVLINQAVHTLDLMIYFAGAAESVSAMMNNYSLKDVIEVEDTVDSYIKFKNGAHGIFYATNAYSKNSSVQLELEFENKSFICLKGNLISDGEVICTDSKKCIGKQYWGSGHARTLQEFYTNKTSLCLDDVKDTMYTMFAIYESAEKCKEIIL